MTQRKRKDPTQTVAYKKKKEAESRRNVRKIIAELVELKSIIWPRDIVIFRDLYSLYPDVNFWLNLNWFQEKVPTIAFYATEKQKARLIIEWAKFNLVIPKKQEYLLEDTKIGEDYTFSPVKKNILDFCKK